MANSYKDSKWSNLSTITEKRLGLPEGLLRNIVLHGEKSNADQVSSAGAKTVFQIIPQTRDAILKKYKFDAYESDKNSALAAGYLLKEALDRNNGNVEAAIGEYHGGTDRKNWGPVNKAYRQRVLSAMSVNSQPKQTQSTFQRVRANFQQEQAPAIAKVYDAYQSGKLNPQQKKDFENDVRSGVIMLPEGGQLLGNAKSQPVTLPQSVSDAYVNGKLSEQQRSDLEMDMKAGLVKLPVASKNKSDLPDFDASGRIAQEPTEQGVLPDPKPEASLGQKISGGLEAAATVGSGLIGAPIGQTIGTIKGAAQALIDGNLGTPQAAQNILNTANTAAHALMYEPRTAVGQENVQGIGEFIQDVGLDTLPPVMGGIGVAAGTLGGASVPVVSGAARDLAHAAKPVINQAIQRPIQATTNAIRSGVDGLKDAVGLNRDTGTNPAPANIGAAQAGQEQIRRDLFNEFDVPATNPQITRRADEVKDLYETMRGGGEAGQLIRDRLEDQSRAIESALHRAIDDTGSNASDVFSTGENISKALDNQMNIESVNVRKKYATADASKESENKVDLSVPVKWSKDELLAADEKGIRLDNGSVLDLLNQNQGLKSTGVYSDAKTLAVNHGIADLDSSGNLVARAGNNSPNLRQMETWRKEIRSTINQADNADIAAGSRIIGMIDNATAKVAGNLYKDARKARSEFAKKWENRGIITDLIQNKKGGDDRRVAIENIVDRITSTKTSKDDVSFIRRVMDESGEDGKQAWRDLQGTVINKIREEAFSGVQDTRGSETLLASKMDKAIKRLDTAGKLDDIFDRQQAERLRGLNELTKTMLTLPPHTGINWSNTAKAVLAGIADLVIFGMTGMPPVVASALRLAVKHIQDRKALVRAKRMLDVNLPNRSNP